MSTPTGPPSRRRRIAGEAKPGVPTPTPPTPKPTRRPLVRPGKSGGAAQETPVAPVTPPKVVTPKPKKPKQKVEPQPTPQPEQDRTPAAAAVAPADETSSASAPRRAWRGRAPLVVVAIAALVFGAVFGVRGFLEWNQTRGIAAAHSAAAESAAAAAETIFSYRYDRLDEHLEDSQELMTPSFAKEFETISPALNDLAPQRKIQVQASTRQAAATPCGDDCSASEAEVLVFIDQARVADDDKTPTVFGNRITVTMVERDGDWLVNDVKAL